MSPVECVIHGTAWHVRACSDCARGEMLQWSWAHSRGRVLRIEACDRGRLRLEPVGAGGRIVARVVGSPLDMTRLPLWID